MDTYQPSTAVPAPRVPVLTQPQIIYICELAAKQARASATFTTKRQAATRTGVPLTKQRAGITKAKQQLFNYLRSL